MGFLSADKAKSRSKSQEDKLSIQEKNDLLHIIEIKINETIESGRYETSILISPKERDKHLKEIIRALEEKNYKTSTEDFGQDDITTLRISWK